MAVPPGSPDIYYSCRSLDGQLNATLADGDPVATITNLGSLGAAANQTAVSAATFVNGIVPVLRSDGTNYYQTAAFSPALAQPNLIVAIFSANQAAGSVAICDGISGGTDRALVYDNGITINMAAGSFPGSAPALTIARGQYNYVLARFNGASSSYRRNGQGSTVSATVGTQDLGGLTIMAAADGTLGVDGDLLAFVLWNGVVPTDSEVENWVDAEFQCGYPRIYPTQASYPPFVGTPAVTIPAAGPLNVVVFGDSITSPIWAWHEVDGGFIDQLNAARDDDVTLASYGVGSSTIAPFAGSSVLSFYERLPAVLAANPDCDLFVIQGGVNDVVGGSRAGGNPISAFWNYGRWIVKTIRQSLPDAQIMWVNILCRGEMYPDPLGPMIDQYVAATAAICQLYEATLVDVRTVQQAYEAANNVPPPGAGSGILTADGVHTGLLGTPAGAVLMGTTAMGRITVT